VGGLELENWEDFPVFEEEVVEEMISSANTDVQDIVTSSEYFLNPPSALCEKEEETYEFNI